jgi:hypothetical protein
MFGMGGAQHSVRLTLYTDAFVIVGTIDTRQRRISDILNQADDPFIVLADVTFDEFGTTGLTLRTEYAQVNLASVLFAVGQDTVQPVPELRTTKQAEEALISIPPFKVTGHIHVLPERSLREALRELTGAFIPVTEATYWSDQLKEARATATIVAVNHARAQILAPHRVVDPWSGMPAATSITAEDAASLSEWPATDRPPPRSQDPEPSGW